MLLQKLKIHYKWLYYLLFFKYLTEKCFLFWIYVLIFLLGGATKREALCWPCSLKRGYNRGQHWGCIWTHGPGLHHISFNHWNHPETGQLSDSQWRWYNHHWLSAQGYWDSPDLFHLCVNGFSGLVLQWVQLCQKEHAPGCDCVSLLQNHNVYLHAFAGKNTEEKCLLIYGVVRQMPLVCYQISKWYEHLGR